MQGLTPILAPLAWRQPPSMAEVIVPLVCVYQAPLQPQPPLPQPLPGFGSALQPSADNHTHVTNLRTQRTTRISL